MREGFRVKTSFYGFNMGVDGRVFSGHSHWPSDRSHRHTSAARRGIERWRRSIRVEIIPPHCSNCGGGTSSYRSTAAGRSGGLFCPSFWLFGRNRRGEGHFCPSFWLFGRKCRGVRLFCPSFWLFGRNCRDEGHFCPSFWLFGRKCRDEGHFCPSFWLHRCLRHILRDLYRSF